MSYWLHEEAEADLHDAAAYYARQASKEIALAFLSEFERVIELLAINQRLGRPRHGSIRTFLFRRFLYSVVYRDDDAGPQVYAIAHQSREPGYCSEGSRNRKEAQATTV